jgi:hypothetical protein
MMHGQTNTKLVAILNADIREKMACGSLLCMSDCEYRGFILVCIPVLSPAIISELMGGVLQNLALT